MGKNDDEVRILPLGELKDLQVAEGYPDIRGWKVDSADGVHVGKVHELLVDEDSMRTRYLDVRLTSELAAAPQDRDVLIPIGSAQLDDAGKRVIVPLAAERVGLLPPYAHGVLTRAHEYEVRRHFSLGEAAAATVAGAANAANVADAAASRGFYDDASYDDRRFFSKRTAGTPVEHETRIPVSPDDTVVLKRVDEGRDEIIIRRPRTGNDEVR